MPNETNKPPRKPGGWSAVKQHMKEWDSAQFTAIIRDLYDISADNRLFLEARIQAEEQGSTALETYRQQIIEQFFPKRGEAKLNLDDARRAIRNYRRATGNTEGTIELLLTYLESGNDFTCKFGDIDGPFYNSLCSVMDDLASLLREEGQDAYEKVTDRLYEVATKADGIGWGYGEYITRIDKELESELGEK